MALWKEKIASILCLLCLSGSPRRYVPAHLLHHRYPDSPNDPHSPSYVGILAPLTFRYRNWPHVEEDIPANLNTEFHKRLDHVWFWPVVIFEYVLLLFNWKIAIFGFMLPTVLLLYSQALSAIIGGHIPHPGSYRVYDTPDNSVNSIPGFFLGMSEAWHNNHHEFPNDPNFGRRWWELDPSYWLICLIRD
jgi:stearoyl-CoA desaturase (delta-9 desaturase)